MEGWLIVKLLHTINVLLSFLTGFLWQDFTDESPSQLDNLPFPAAILLVVPIYIGGFAFLYAPVGLARLMMPWVNPLQPIERSMRKPLKVSLNSILAIYLGYFFRRVWRGSHKI